MTVIIMIMIPERRKRERNCTQNMVNYFCSRMKIKVRPYESGVNFYNDDYVHSLVSDKTDRGINVYNTSGCGIRYKNKEDCNTSNVNNIFIHDFTR